ncbi:MAG TPA: hypothetical protein VED01_00660 [Burkholderiales bacterium]|nr:hypothetical protein [Burkholderiales bacterium]
MSASTAKTVRAQSSELRGIDIGEGRAAQIAEDIGRILEAADAARGLLDFNDEPSRFTAVLASSSPTGRARRR